MPEAFVDRLYLDDDRLAEMIRGVREVAALPDPVGEIVEGRRLANGLELNQVRVPLGVVAVVYEARPNVTVDAAALCLKSGNAVVLRGGSAAHDTPTACSPRSCRGRCSRPACPPTAVDLHRRLA